MAEWAKGQEMTVPALEQEIIDETVDELMPGLLDRWLMRDVEAQAEGEGAVIGTLEGTWRFFDELISGQPEIAYPPKFIRDVTRVYRLTAAGYKATEEGQKKAAALAINTMANSTWGVSYFGGKWAMMEHPPEKIPDAVIDAGNINPSMASALIVREDLLDSLFEAGLSGDAWDGRDMSRNALRTMMEEGNIRLEAFAGQQLGVNPKYRVFLNFEDQEIELLDEFSAYQFNGEESRWDDMVTVVAREVNDYLPDALRASGFGDIVPTSWLYDIVFQQTLFNRNLEQLQVNKDQRSAIEKTSDWIRKRLVLTFPDHFPRLMDGQEAGGAPVLEDFGSGKPPEIRRGPAVDPLVPGSPEIDVNQLRQDPAFEPRQSYGEDYDPDQN